MSVTVNQNLEAEVKKKNEDELTLFQAVKKNDVPKVKELLFQGVDVNARNHEKKTPLHMTAWHNTGDKNYEMAELLLSSKADVNARDKDDRTPLFFLCQASNLRIFKLFLKFNSKINVID